MKALKLPIALLIAALICTINPPALNNSTTQDQTKVQAVSVESPRKEVTGVNKVETEEKTQTNQPVVVEPETVAATPEPVPAPAPQPLTNKEQLMQAAGIPQSDWAATDYIVSHESSWITTNTNPNSGAYGLCQALPKEKMASAGDDYNSNPVTQLKWCHQYAHSRYNGWTFAAAFWSVSRWW